MSIGTALAKKNDINRRVRKGKRTTLYLYDKTSQELKGRIRSWNVERLTSLQPESPNFRFTIAQDRVTATKENLSEFDLVFNGELYDVVDRDEPLGEKEILWTVLARPNGNKIDIS